MWVLPGDNEAAARVLGCVLSAAAILLWKVQLPNAANSPSSSWTAVRLLPRLQSCSESPRESGKGFNSLSFAYLASDAGHFLTVDWEYFQDCSHDYLFIPAPPRSTEAAIWHQRPRRAGKTNRRTIVCIVRSHGSHRGSKQDGSVRCAHRLEPHSEAQFIWSQHPNK